MIFVHDQVEKIVGKGENAGYQHFLLFPQCFQHCGQELNTMWEKEKCM